MDSESTTATVEENTPDNAPAENTAPESDKPKGKSKKKAKAEPVEILKDLPQRVEAALMTTDRPFPPAKLSDVLGGIGVKAVKEAIDALNKVYAKTERSFRAELVAGGYQILTLPEYADVLSAMHKTRSSQKLSPAAMETLAIVAYKQPILRAEIEAIRGVACGEVLRGLMDRHLVKIAGRAEELGRPILYGTTKLFLETFGLSSLDDLPNVEDLSKGSA